MIFDSGSVKLRCAVGFGLNGSRPSRGGRGVLPCASSSARARRLALARLGLKRLPWPPGSSPAAPRDAAAPRAAHRRDGPARSARPPRRRACSASREQRRDVRAQRRDLRLQLRLLLDHPLVAHRLMPRGVRAQLRAIQRQSSPARPARASLAQPQRLHEQPRQRLQMPSGTARSTGSPGADQRTTSAPPHRDRSRASSLREDGTPFAYP